MNSPKMASTERSAMLLYTAARAAKNFASILDFDEILQKTVDIICDEFDFYYAGVFLNDTANKSAVLRAGRGEAGDAMIAAGHKLEIGGNSMIGNCIASQEARISLDVGEESVFFKNPHLPKTRSEMGLPLILHGNEAIGALTVQSVEEAAFTQEDIAALQTMADQLAVAIENARLHQQAQRRATYMEAANKVGHNLASVLDLDILLPKTVNVICEAYDFYYAGVFLVDETGQWAVLQAGRGAAGAAMIAAGHKLEVGGNSMIGDCIANKVARISLDVGEESVFFKNPHLPETRSEMGLPLVVGDEVLGAVTVQSIEEAAFSEEDISTLQTMADHLAIAIRNAYTLRELEEAHANLLRQKTYEALATATTQAIHWIGNKALPITTTVDRMRLDLEEEILDVESFQEDLGLIDMSARLIVQVKENLIGPAREEEPRYLMIDDIAKASAGYAYVPAEKFEIEMAADAPEIYGDSTQLVRVFNNLYKNSIEANANKINVSITASSDSKTVMITVKDDGDGIAPDMLEKVWASFITTKGASHNGLGLAACLHVIGQHGGAISVESEVGVGTTFTVVLPAAPTIEEDAASGLSGKLILIDDQDRWSDFAVQALQAAGMQVTRQTDANGAETADYVLLDDSLLANDLEIVLGQLESSGASSKTTVLGAGVTVERTTYYLNHGIKDVFLKPYTATDLAALLK